MQEDHGHDHEEASGTAWLDRVNDAYYDRLGKIAGRRTRDRVNWMCAQCSGQTVLDIGCSQGITSILLGREGYRVVGIDITPQAIEYAQRELGAEPAEVRDRVAFERIDLLSMPIGEGYDNVILGEVIEHQTSPDRFVEAAARHVRPGGRLIITVPFGLHPFPDHKCTIFPRDVTDTLGDAFRYIWLDTSGGYIRIVATRGAAPGARAIAAAELLDVTQRETVGIQNQYFQSLQTVRGLKAEKKQQAEESKEARERISALTLELERLKIQSLALRADSLRMEQGAEHASRRAQAANEQAQRAKRQLAHLQAEHAQLKIDKRKQSLALAGALAATRELTALRTSRSFRLGSALVRATKSPRDFCALPVRLVRALRAASSPSFELPPVPAEHDGQGAATSRASASAKRP